VSVITREKRVSERGDIEKLEEESKRLLAENQNLKNQLIALLKDAIEAAEKLSLSTLLAVFTRKFK
jgi:hypothetical protein